MPVEWTKGKVAAAVPVKQSTQPKTHAHATPSTHQMAYDLWGIDPKFPLQSAIADFYLLYALFIDGLDEGKFSLHVDYVYAQVLSYTDMVIGGELRYARKFMSGTGIPLPLRKAFIHGEIPEKRSDAWRGWWGFRARHGAIALSWAASSFRLLTGGGVGGPKWAHIADVLRQHESDMIPQITFLDTCFGLQHNGGIYFNKVWSVVGVQDVLDANLKGDASGVLLHASFPIHELFLTQEGSL
jgi:hypothetical protein